MISVEWISGQSPAQVPPVDGTESTPSQQRSTRSSKTVSRPRAASRPTQTTPQKHLGLPPDLRPGNLPNLRSKAFPPRRFTIHPDEVEEIGTVRRSPSPERRPIISANAGAYRDLFSPMHPQRPESTKDPSARALSPPRSRPRISSQTFKRNIPPLRGPAATPSRTRPSASSSFGSSISRTPDALAQGTRRFKARRTSAKVAPLRVSADRWAGVDRRFDSQRSKGPPAAKVITARDATLPDDSQATETGSKPRNTSNNLQGHIVGHGPWSEPSPLHAKPRVKQPEAGLVRHSVHGRDGSWPTDSVQGSSWSDFDDGGIWISSDSAKKAPSLHRHPLFRRPPARQTSRSELARRDGTMSTVQTRMFDDPHAVPSAGTAATALLLRSPDDYVSARSIVSAEGEFAPASDDVRSLFPRTSSVSPKNERKPVKPLLRKPSQSQLGVSRAEGVNPALCWQHSSPWERAKKVMSMTPPAADTTRASSVLTRAGGVGLADRACAGCAENATRVQQLENEVSTMRVEMVGLKAAVESRGPTIASRLGAET